MNKEKNIHSVLGTLSENILIEKKFNEQNEYESSTGDINTKENSSENNQMSLDRMRQEYIKRKEDFVKVVQFEQSFPKKIQHLQLKLDNLNDELKIFDNVQNEKVSVSSSIRIISFPLNYIRKTANTSGKL